MQIVIDIPKEIYDDIMSHNRERREGAKSAYYFEGLIQNGTPLPKGHGRLKDIDEIEWYGCTTAFDCPYKERECKDCDRAECSKTQVDDIPTIIEADKEIDRKETNNE